MSQASGSNRFLVTGYTHFFRGVAGTPDFKETPASQHPFAAIMRPDSLSRQTSGVAQSVPQALTCADCLSSYPDPLKDPKKKETPNDPLVSPI